MSSEDKGSPAGSTSEEVLRRYNEERLPDFCEALVHANQRGTFGNHPIHVAAFRGEVGDVLALLRGGADVNAVGDMGSTPLHEAVGEGHVEVVRCLLRHGARGDVRDEFGKTALDLAMEKGLGEIVEVLRG